MNSIIIIGNLGKDATSKQHGEKFNIQFSVATTHKYKDQDYTTWHNVSYWSKSNAVTQYLTKGKKVAVQGQQKHDKQKDGQGYYSYIDARQVELLSKNENKELPF